MQDDHRITFWGNLDQIVRLLEQDDPKFALLWKNQTYRMSPEDIARMNKYLSAIQYKLTAMKMTLRLFDAIPTNAQIEHAKAR